MLDHNGDPITEAEWYVVRWQGPPYADDKLAVSAGQAEDLSEDAVTLRPYSGSGFLAMGLRIGLDQITDVWRTTPEVTRAGTFDPGTDALGRLPRRHDIVEFNPLDASLPVSTEGTEVRRVVSSTWVESSFEANSLTCERRGHMVTVQYAGGMYSIPSNKVTVIERAEDPGA